MFQQNITLLLLIAVLSEGAPSISRLESVEQTSLNTIDSDSYDRSMKMTAQQDELFPFINSSPSSSTTESSIQTNLYPRFHSMMERLSSGQGFRFPVPFSIDVVNSDMVNKRIIYTAPQLGDTNPDFKPE